MDPVPVHRFLTVGNRVFIREIFPQNLQSLVVRSVFHVFPGLSLQSLFLRRAAFLFQKPVDTPDLSVVAQLSSSRLIRRRSVPAPWGNSPPPMSFRSRIRRRRTVLRSAAPLFSFCVVCHFFFLFAFLRARASSCCFIFFSSAFLLSLFFPPSLLKSLTSDVLTSECHCTTPRPVLPTVRIRRFRCRRRSSS